MDKAVEFAERYGVGIVIINNTDTLGFEKFYVNRMRVHGVIVRVYFNYCIRCKTLILTINL